MNRPAAAALGAALLVTLALLPKLVPAYGLTVAFLLCVFLALAASWDLVGGRLGYLNLGHGTFFGLGAYGAAILLARGASVPAAFGVGLLSSALAALLLAYPLFRLRGAYFALATLGLPGLMEVLAKNFGSLTGGSGGISTPPGDRTTTGYYLAVLLALGTVASLWAVSRSRFGLGLVSIREDEEAAAAFGVPVGLYKVSALTLSSVPASLAGALYAWTLTYISPSSVFGLEVALTPVVMAMLGGSGTLLGPALGALFLTLVQEFLWTRLPHFHLALYGGCLVLLGLFSSGGLVGRRRPTPARPKGEGT